MVEFALLVVILTQEDAKIKNKSNIEQQQYKR
jgi:hypothetical protein